MRWHMLLIVAAGLLVAAEARKGDTAKKERDKLQGYWDVIAAEQNGQRIANKELKRLQIIFTDKRLTLSKGDKESFDAQYHLHPTQDPKTIDIKFLMGPDEGKIFKGLYKLNGNKLTICWSESGQKRPTSFTTGPKSGRTMYILKRSKPK